MRYILTFLFVIGFATIRGIDFRLVIVAIIGSLVVGAVITTYFWKEGKWENRRRPIKSVVEKIKTTYLGKAQLCWGGKNRKQTAPKQVAAKEGRWAEI